MNSCLDPNTKLTIPRKIWASLVVHLVKNLACNAGDPSPIPGLGRSLWEGIGHPLHYSWAFLVSHTVQNQSPAMPETWFWSLGLEDHLEEDTARLHTPVILFVESQWTEKPGGLQSMGLQRIGHDWTTKQRKVYLWRDNHIICCPIQIVDIHIVYYE